MLQTKQTTHKTIGKFERQITMNTDPRLEKIRQLMKEEAEKKNNPNRSSSNDNASYPFWDIPKDTIALIRHIPDKDESNPWFWIETQAIKLPFAGTVGGDAPTDNPITVRVPCVDMFGDTCPIIAETKPWWKDESKKDLARTYYKKRSFIAQGFVVSSQLEEKSVPEDPIRRFIYGSELIEKLKAGMADTDMEFFPTDYLNGYDFRIRKTIRKSDGREFNNYSTFDWSHKVRPLTESELLAIEQHGLFNLADFRGPRPDADGIAAIKAMFHASLAGDPYDFAAFGKYYRPYGVNAGTATSDESDDVAPVVHTARTETKAKVEETPSSVQAGKGMDTLTKLRERIASSKKS